MYPFVIAMYFILPFNLCSIFFFVVVSHELISAILNGFSLVTEQFIYIISYNKYVAGIVMCKHRQVHNPRHPSPYVPVQTVPIHAPSYSTPPSWAVNLTTVLVGQPEKKITL